MRLTHGWAVGALVTLLLAVTQPLPPAAPPNSTLFWTYLDTDLTALSTAPVVEFLVCLDGQATAVCARVPVGSGTPAAPGEQEYTWRLPALAPGPHTVAVQACTAGAGQCSAGASLAFRIVAIADPKRLGIR